MVSVHISQQTESVVFGLLHHTIFESERLFSFVQIRLKYTQKVHPFSRRTSFWCYYMVLLLIEWMVPLSIIDYSFVLLR